MRYLHQIYPVLLALIAFGCAGKGSENDNQSSGNNAGILTREEPLVTVSLLDENVWKDIRKQNNGKILFVNIWATWCLPCKEEFPDLVKLSEEYQNSDVAIIGVSVDYPDEVDDKVRPFLQAQGAGFQNYVQNFKKPEDLINLFNEKWRGAVPATFIYNKAGIQKVFLLGKQSYDDFREAIEATRNGG